MDGLKFKRRNLGKTEVITGENLAEEINAYFTHTMAEGAICLVYDRNVVKIAEDISRELKRGGYRIFMLPVSSARHKDAGCAASAPEFARHVLAVGAGTAAECAKKIAKSLDAEWTMFLTAPSTDTIMREFAPKAVFIDKNVMLNCPYECKAAGYGILFSQPLKMFERFFASRVLAKETGKTLTSSPTPNDICELAYTLLAISQDGERDSAQIAAEILYQKAIAAGKRPRLIGEYKFLASACIASLYSSYLSAPSIDAMPPACRDDARDKLKAMGFDNPLKSVDFFDLNGYFRISYILGEYRTDLLDKLGSIDFHTTQRFWRRLYPDAGYWLKGELNCNLLIECATLAGSISDNLLGYAYASGVLCAHR